MAEAVEKRINGVRQHSSRVRQIGLLRQQRGDGGIIRDVLERQPIPRLWQVDLGNGAKSSTDRRRFADGRIRRCQPSRT